ncbi:MAG: DUF5043 domain-containing protein [Dysgonamonadaceae bacterium]|jgi:hypothetical protein|nr:DUF5043 domain-containing protein [Dysgonamonadaceae bacterium]
MKRTNKLLFVCLLLSLSRATAQTGYYNQSDRLCESGYCYRWDTSVYGIVMLYNADNQYTYSHSVYRDENPDGFSRIENLFSDVEKQGIKGEQLDIFMTIDTGTGQIVEVDFCFYPSDFFAAIPLSTYRKIELELKNSIRFLLADSEKQQVLVQIKWKYVPV